MVRRTQRSSYVTEFVDSEIMDMDINSLEKREEGAVHAVANQVLWCQGLITKWPGSNTN